MWCRFRATGKVLYPRSRILKKKILIHRLGEHVAQVGAHLKHGVLGAGFCQLVHVHLKRESIEVLQWNFAEVIQNVRLDQTLLGLCCFFLPVPFLEREVAVPAKPVEAYNTFTYSAQSAPGLLSYYNLSGSGTTVGQIENSQVSLEVTPVSGSPTILSLTDSPSASVLFPPTAPWPP